CMIIGCEVENAEDNGGTEDHCYLNSSSIHQFGDHCLEITLNLSFGDHSAFTFEITLKSKDSQQIDPIIELDNDNDINIDLDGDDMEMERIDGLLSEMEMKVLAHLLGNLDKKERAKCKKCGAIYLSAYTHGTDNASRHLKTCEKTTTRDLGQMLLSQSESSMSLRVTKFDLVDFCEMLNLVILGITSFQLCGV
ncbi:hypothetical protein GIB67_019656, partial [Kingdonia uniflora]